MIMNRAFLSNLSSYTETDSILENRLKNHVFHEIFWFTPNKGSVTSIFWDKFLKILQNLIIFVAFFSICREIYEGCTYILKFRFHHINILSEKGTVFIVKNQIYFILKKKIFKDNGQKKQLYLI